MDSVSRTVWPSRPVQWVRYRARGCGVERVAPPQLLATELIRHGWPWHLTHSLAEFFCEKIQKNFIKYLRQYTTIYTIYAQTHFQKYFFQTLLDSRKKIIWKYFDLKDTICRITLKANKLSVSDIGARTRRPSPGHCSNRNHKSNFQSAHSSILTLFTLTFGKPSAGHFRLAEQYFGHPWSIPTVKEYGRWC